MITYAVSKDAVAMIFGVNESPSVKYEVNRCLKKQGYDTWPDMEAELFSLSGRSMLIARPLSPLSRRYHIKAPRLRRS